MADGNELAPPTVQPPLPPPDLNNPSIQAAPPAGPGPNGGALGHAAMGMLAGAENAHNAPTVKEVMQDPKFLSLSLDAQKITLSKMDPNFAKLSPAAQHHVVTNLPRPPQTQDESMPEMTQALSGQYLSPEAQTEANRKEAPLSAMVTGGLLAGPAGAGIGQVVGAAAGPLAGAAAGGATSSAVQDTAMQLGQTDNPFRVKRLALAAATGAVIGAGVQKAGEVVNAVRGASVAEPEAEGVMSNPLANKAEDELPQITDRHITKIPPQEMPPAPQHGKPVESAAPFDWQTINNMPGGKNLSEGAVNTLKGYTGEVIPVGSTPKNLMIKAVEPVQETIAQAGREMNKLVESAQPFKSSVLESANEGTEGVNSLAQDLEDIRKNLPGGTEEMLTKTVDKEFQSAFPALESHDPKTVLAYKRVLGGQINWNDIKFTGAETPGEVQNLTKVKIYQALRNKLQNEIEGMAELDKVFQPNLELRSHMEAKLGEALVKNPSEATYQHLTELDKGKRLLAAQAHNANVEKNWSLIKKAAPWLAAGTIGAGAEVLRH